MSFQSSCPGCSDTVEFRVESSVVTVCESCGTVCGRGDGKLEDFGKVADLTQTPSPLKIGLVGECNGVPYEITGRTQLKHAAGGVWDEWYVAFRDGKRWGWLAEARGRYYLTFRKKLPDHHGIPPVDELDADQQVMVPSQGVMSVAEVGEATGISAEGEIPFEFHPGETYTYADLEGPGGKFATIEQSGDGPVLYLGGEFPLKRLGIAEDVADREQEAAVVTAVAVNCTACGGSLELNAPEAERVVCPFCGAMHDVNVGNLQFLKKLDVGVKPLIPLGSKGRIDGREYKVIGFMQRKVRAEGTNYYWYEYLLYAPRTPFHWLVHSENHWTFSGPVSAGSVTSAMRTATWDGRSFRLFDKGSPEVTFVSGEFYWKVEVGERVDSADYISPPYLLSREFSIATTPREEPGIPPIRVTGKKSRTRAREVNYTVGRYITPEEVKAAFGLKHLPEPSSIAPNQPYQNKGLYPVCFLLLFVALLIGAIAFTFASRKQVLAKSYALKATPNAHHEIHTATFTLTGGKNIRISASTPQTRHWAYVDGVLHNEETGQDTTFTVPIKQSKAGRGQQVSRFLSALPAGNYMAKLKFKWQDMNTQSQTVEVRLHQGVPRFRYLVLLILSLCVVPVGLALHHGAFEARRWANSGFGPFSE